MGSEVGLKNLSFSFCSVVLVPLSNRSCLLLNYNVQGAKNTFSVEHQSNVAAETDYVFHATPIILGNHFNCLILILYYLLFFFRNHIATFKCCKCTIEIKLDECFKDRAIAIELKKATLKCRSVGCSWKGLGNEYSVS